MLNGRMERNRDIYTCPRCLSDTLLMEVLMQSVLNQSLPRLTASVWLILAFALSGCSAGWSHRYDNLAPRVDARGFGKVIVVTRDQRPYIVSGERKPQYVGTVRSLYSEPWDIMTASGRSFAQDLSNAVCNALSGQGYECLPLASGRSDVAAEVEYFFSRWTSGRVMFSRRRSWITT
jgi:hypothetical protein